MFQTYVILFEASMASMKKPPFIHDIQLNFHPGFVISEKSITFTEIKSERIMQVHNLALTNSLFSNFLSEMRNVNVQQDRMRFRRNMERTGEILAYELSKTL